MFGFKSSIKTENITPAVIAQWGNLYGKDLHLVELDGKKGYLRPLSEKEVEKLVKKAYRPGTGLATAYFIKKVLKEAWLGGDPELIENEAFLKQSAAAGRLMGQDARQMIDAGFNPLQAMSEKTGKSLAVLNKEMSAGKISFQQVTEAYQYATGPMGKYYKGMENMANSSTGKWMAFTGALETLAGTVGTKLLPMLGVTATALNSLIGNEPILYGIAAGIGAMTLAWGVYTAYVQRAAIWQGILTAIAFAPIAIFGLIVAGITILCYKFDSWGKSAKAAWEITKDYFSSWKIGLTEIAQEIAYVFESAFLRIKNFFQQIGGAWQKVKQGNFSGIMDGVKTDSQGKLSAFSNQRSLAFGRNIRGIVANGVDTYSQFQKIHFDTKTSKGGLSPVDVFTGGQTNRTGSGLPASVAETSKAISGGGSRNITINVGNLGTGKIDIHTTTIGEGLENLRKQIEEIFLQVVNSGNAAVAQ